MPTALSASRPHTSGRACAACRPTPCATQWQPIKALLNTCSLGLEARWRTTWPMYLGRPQATGHARAFQQVKAVGQGGVACVIELAQHFLVTEDLAAVHAGQVKNAAQQRGFLSRRHQQHVFADGGFDQRVADIGSPAAFVMHQGGGAWVATIKDELLQAKAKGVAHFGIAPVAQAGDFKSTGHALAQAMRNQQRGRAEDDHPDIAPGGGVFVPQAFDFFRPLGHFLNFVQHQNTVARLCGERTRHLPLGAQPDATLQTGPIGTGAVLSLGVELGSSCASRCKRFSAWRTSVVLPTWRGPATTCKKSRGSLSLTTNGASASRSMVIFEFAQSIE